MRLRSILYGAFGLALLVFFFEVGASLVFWLASKSTTHDERQYPYITSFTSFPYYQDKEWATPYWKEFRDSQNHLYTPFIGWKRQPFAGRFINVDAKGIRKSWNPEPAKAVDLPTIYFFGGSTAWGTGARDDMTIPSILSKMLADQGRSHHVVNHGEAGYTFLQECIALLLMLRAGERPDLIVFYDGVNEVYSGYQQGYAGSKMNVTQYQRKLLQDNLSPWEHLVQGSTGALTSSGTYRSWQLVRTLTRRQPLFVEKAARFSDPEIDSLAREVVESYRTTLDMLDGITAQFDVAYQCFWQPTALAEKVLLDEERRNGDPRMTDHTLHQLTQRTWEYMRAASPSNLFDISDAVSERRSPVYFDWCHLTEDGNAMVARAILERLIGTGLIR